MTSRSRARLARTLAHINADQTAAVPVKAQVDYDVIVVGAGFGGLVMLKRLRGLGLSCRVFEKGTDIGGTWYWNRYPGIQCDVPSFDYSLQIDEVLEQQWRWKDRYAGGGEILEYAAHIADRYGLRRDIQFNTRVDKAIFDEGQNVWRVETSDGVTQSAQFVVMATGCLSEKHTPDFPGLESFKGELHYTAEWPHEGVNLKDKRVGIVGTGATALQVIPAIVDKCKHLTIFQRTAHYSVPAVNYMVGPLEDALVKSTYRQRRTQAADLALAFVCPSVGPSALLASPEEREVVFEDMWKHGGLGWYILYQDTLFDRDSNKLVREFVSKKIRQIVKDPKIAELLVPKTDMLIGCKRIPLQADYYEVFNRDDVTLVDVSKEAGGIERILPNGIQASGGQVFDLDTIILATGFDAMVGALQAIDIRGRNNASLREKWKDGPNMYLGLLAAGFPNLFAITGPGSPSVLANMIPSIETHTAMIASMISHLHSKQLTTIEPTQQAQMDWMDHVKEIADATVFPDCDSWYTGSNIPGKPRSVPIYLAGYGEYAKEVAEVVAKGYAGLMCR